MSKLKDDVRDSLAIIDAIKNMVEENASGKRLKNLNYKINLPGFTPSWNANISTNPFDFLLALLQKFMTYEEIVQWLAKYIVYELPVIELGVKTVLLASLKETIDCTNDPRIPEKYRMKLNPLSFEQDFLERESYYGDRGIVIPFSKIDFLDILNVSPFTELGQTLYFGVKIKYKLFINNQDESEIQSFFNYAELAKYVVDHEIPINDVWIDEYREVDTVWELARPRDLDAFLWFVSHKAKFPNSIAFTDDKYDFVSGGSMNFKEDYVVPPYSAHPFSDCAKDDSVLGVLNGKCNIIIGGTQKPFIPGQTLIQNAKTTTPSGEKVLNSNVLSLCLKSYTEKINLAPIDEEYEEEEERKIVSATNKSTEAFGGIMNTDNVLAVGPSKYTFTMVPVSCNYNSANWYINRSTYFDFLNPKKNKDKPRDYTKEFALFNLSYVGGDTSEYSDCANGAVRMQIMPRPFWHMPQLGFDVQEYVAGNPLTMETFEVAVKNRGKVDLLPKRILFDAYGKKSRKGKYTVKVGKMQYVVLKKNGDVVTEEVTDLITKDDNVKAYWYPVFNVNGDQVNELYIDVKTHDYWLSKNDSTSLALSLHECYPGITVYEFNYDFVMGTQLYDAEQVASRLILSLMNLQVGGNLGFSKYETPYQMRIAHIVKKMIEQTTSEVTDCFFTFSNEEYDNMLRQSELKRANLFPFNDSEQRYSTVDGDAVLNILREYDNNASLEENVDVIKRAIMQASASITPEAIPSDAYSIRCNFVIELVKAIVTILIDTLFTPKLMMLILVNKEIMGGGLLSYIEKKDAGVDFKDQQSFEDIMKSIMNIILKMIKELINMVLQLILEEVLKKIAELIAMILDSIVAEQLNNYLEIIRECVEKCTVPLWLINLFRSKNLDTVLDPVNYADIIESIGDAMPPTDEC